MLPPLPRCSGWVYSSLISPSRVSLPRKGSPGRPAHRPFRGLLGVSGPAIRRLQTFRLLHACSGCFRLERIVGWGLHHWKAPPCHGAPPFRSLPIPVPRSLEGGIKPLNLHHRLLTVRDPSAWPYCLVITVSGHLA